ncbi:SAM domain-containing protein [Plasmodiophora brassicae]
MEDILGGPPLSDYLPSFTRLGFTDRDFILSEDKDAWDAMLDLVAADKDAPPLRPGHRMMIISRLRKAKLDRERDGIAGVQQTVTSQPMGQQHLPTLKGGTSARQGDLDERRPSSILLDGFAPCLRMPRLGQALVVLGTLTISLVLYGLYAGASVQDGSEAVQGGWLFVKVLYIVGFTLTGAFALVCAAAGREGQQAAALSLPDLSCPECADCSIQMPECPACDCLPSCDDMESCMYKLYRIVCCKCSITIN